MSSLSWMLWLCRVDAQESGNGTSNTEQRTRNISNTEHKNKKDLCSINQHIFLLSSSRIQHFLRARHQRGVLIAPTRTNTRLRQLSSCRSWEEAWCTRCKGRRDNFDDGDDDVTHIRPTHDCSCRVVALSQGRGTSGGSVLVEPGRCCEERTRGW